MVLESNPYTGTRETMGDSDNDQKQPKFVRAQSWFGFGGYCRDLGRAFAFLRLWSQSRHLIVEFFHRNDSRLQGMLRKFTRRGTHAFSGGFQAPQVLFRELDGHVSRRPFPQWSASSSATGITGEVI